MELVVGVMIVLAGGLRLTWPRRTGPRRSCLLQQMVLEKTADRQTCWCMLWTQNGAPILSAQPASHLCREDAINAAIAEQAVGVAGLAQAVELPVGGVAFF